MEQKGWLTLSKADIIEIISRDTLGPDGEIQVFQGVHRWGTAQATKSGKELSEVLAGVLDHVRFPLMSTEDVAAKVVSTGLLSQSQTLDLFTYLAQKHTGKGTIKGWNVKDREGSGRLFKFSNHFDTNGIFYWLGTQEGKNKSWTNPFTLGAVDVSTQVGSGWYLIPSGSGGRNDHPTLFARPSTSTWCSSTSDRLVIIDLMKYQLKVTHVTLACVYEPHTYLTSFNVSGSNDKGQWDILFSETSSKVSNGSPFTWTVPKDKFKKSLSLFQV